MPRIICYFSGWFEVNPDNTLIRRLGEDNVDFDVPAVTMAEELKTNPTLTDVILDQFEDASNKAFDGNFEELYLKIEKDDEEGDLSQATDEMLGL